MNFRARQASARLPEPPQAPSDHYEAQWAISETPQNPSQATAAHACPGAIEGCAASPRGPGHVHSRRHANYHYLPYTAAQSNEAAFSARRRPFPDEKGLPAQPRLHYLATYSAGAAKPALPSSSRAVAPQGSRRERRRCDLKPWAST